MGWSPIQGEIQSHSRQRTAIACIHTAGQEEERGIEGLKKVKTTYSEFVKLAEGLQPAVVPCIHASATGGRC